MEGWNFNFQHENMIDWIKRNIKKMMLDIAEKKAIELAEAGVIDIRRIKIESEDNRVTIKGVPVYVRQTEFKRLGIKKKMTEKEEK